MEKEMESRNCFDCRWAQRVLRPGAMPGFYWCQFKHRHLGESILALRACEDFQPWADEASEIDEGNGD